MAASIAALIVMLAGYALIVGLSVDVRSVRDRALSLIDLHAPPPPSPPKQHVEKAHSKAAKQAPSPRNLKNEATKVVVPPPIVPLQAPPPIIAAPRAGIGMASSNGASNRAGPGQGAGGEGNGLGGGGEGDGDGDDTPPRQIKGRLKFSDLPADLRATATDLSVGVRYQVYEDGTVGECKVTKSSGSAELDQRTCQLIEQRFRFKPGRDSKGEPFVATYVETHSWAVDRSEDPPSKP